MRVTFLLPGLGRNVPIGGFKVVYEYANRFVADGFDVSIIYICNPYTQSRKTVFGIIYNLLKYVYKHVCGFSGRSWFDLNTKIVEQCVFSLSPKCVRDADCCVATAVSTAMTLNNIKKYNGVGVYFIQGYEDWAIDKDLLYDTYHYNFRKIVISKELKRIINSEGEDAYYLPNGFDFDKYKCVNPIRLRNPFSISMIYHKSSNKGCEYGFQTLKIVKEKYPNLIVKIFGTSKRPSWLSEDYEYYQQPDDAAHLEINNSSSIFVAPSLSEGWGLTVGEAMLCGEAVVCTDNGGYLELAKHGENALVSPIKDSMAMAGNIFKLLEDDDLRIRIAEAGLRDIKKFSWTNSYTMFKEVCFGNK